MRELLQSIVGCFLSCRCFWCGRPGRKSKKAAKAAKAKKTKEHVELRTYLSLLLCFLHLCAPA